MCTRSNVIMYALVTSKTMSFSQKVDRKYMHGFLHFLACFQLLPLIQNHYRLPCIRFLGSGPKRPMSCRTQGEFPDVRPSIRLSIPPPRWLARPKICPPSPQVSLKGLKSAFQANNQPPQPQICPPDLQLASKASNQPTKGHGLR